MGLGAASRHDSSFRKMVVRLDRPQIPHSLPLASFGGLLRPIVIRAASRCRPPIAIKTIGFARCVFASPPRSDPYSMPTAHFQSNDYAGLHSARDDLRPSALAGKRDWYKTRLSLSCLSCTKVLQFKLHSHNDLREGFQTTAFSLVCHGVSCNVMGRHRSSPCFDDFVRSFRFRFAHFDCRTGGRVIVGNHPCPDRVNDASRLRAFVALGEIASGFVPSQGLRADPR